MGGDKALSVTSEVVMVSIACTSVTSSDSELSLPVFPPWRLDTIADRASSVSRWNSSAPPPRPRLGLAQFKYDLAVQLVQTAIRHVADLTFLPALALVLELEEPSQLLPPVAFLLLVTPDLLVLLRITIANVIGMVLDTMEVSQQGSRTLSALLWSTSAPVRWTQNVSFPSLDRWALTGPETYSI